MDEHSSAVPWRLGDIVLTLALGFAAAVAVVIVLVVLDPLQDEITVISVLSFALYGGVLLGAYLFVVRRRSASFEEIGFAPVRGRTLLMMVPYYFGTAILVGITITVTASLFGEPPTAGEQLALADTGRPSAFQAGLLFVDVAIVGPFVEELFFRGLIYRYVRSRWRLAPAVVVTSLLFALAHPFALLMPAIFVIGVVFAGVVERYGSLYPAIVLHGLINGTAILSYALG